jgi:hypothetical protein
MLERSHKEHATLRSMPKPSTWNNVSGSNTVVVTPNDEVERRGVAPAQIGTDLSQSSTPSLVQRRRDPAIARTDC